ncbi:MAG: hypothetical protein ABI839_06580 [Verrucomicrobiota bacterium]
MTLPVLLEQQPHPALARTPQALAWDGRHMWLSSRDLGHVYQVDVPTRKVIQEIKPPGVAWGAVAGNGCVYFTIGEGAQDDRYIYRYAPGAGFLKLFACPDFTGSYLSFDGQHLYLSQWYQQRILQLDADGEIVRTIEVGAEICGHTFVAGTVYVLRGVEQPEEDWRIARFTLAEKTPSVTDVAKVPFAARSLTFDGVRFWSNHRAADETVSFVLPR